MLDIFGAKQAASKAKPNSLERKSSARPDNNDRETETKPKFEEKMAQSMKKSEASSDRPNRTKEANTRTEVDRSEKERSKPSQGQAALAKLLSSESHSPLHDPLKQASGLDQRPSPVAVQYPSTSEQATPLFGELPEAQPNLQTTEQSQMPPTLMSAVFGEPNSGEVNQDSLPSEGMEKQNFALNLQQSTTAPHLAENLEKPAVTTPQVKAPLNDGAPSQSNVYQISSKLKERLGFPTESAQPLDGATVSSLSPIAQQMAAASQNPIHSQSLATDMQAAPNMMQAKPVPLKSLVEPGLTANDIIDQMNDFADMQQPSSDRMSNLMMGQEKVPTALAAFKAGLMADSKTIADFNKMAASFDNVDVKFTTPGMNTTETASMQKVSQGILGQTPKEQVMFSHSKMSHEPTLKQHVASQYNNQSQSLATASTNQMPQNNGMKTMTLGQNQSSGGTQSASKNGEANKSGLHAPVFERATRLGGSAAVQQPSERGSSQEQSHERNSDSLSNDILKTTDTENIGYANRAESAGATVATEQASSVDFEAKAFSESIRSKAADMANRMAMQGTGQANMRIQDSVIGSVDVTVNLSSDKRLSISIAAGNADLKTKLENQVDSIKDNLENQKFSAVDVKVVSDAGASSSSQNNSQSSDQRNNSQFTGENAQADSQNNSSEGKGDRSQSGNDSQNQRNNQESQSRSDSAVANGNSGKATSVNNKGSLNVQA